MERTTYRKPATWHNSPTAEYEVLVGREVKGRVWKVTIARQFGGTAWSWTGADGAHTTTRAKAAARLTKGATP